MRKWKIALAMAFVAAAVFTPLSIYAQGEAAPDSMTGLDVGEKVPDFTLKDQNSADHSLDSLLAKEGTTVLVFYRSAVW